MCEIVRQQLLFHVSVFSLKHGVKWCPLDIKALTSINYEITPSFSGSCVIRMVFFNNISVFTRCGVLVHSFHKLCFRSQTFAQITTAPNHNRNSAVFSSSGFRPRTEARGMSSYVRNFAFEELFCRPLEEDAILQ